MEKLNGIKILSVSPHYENLTITFEDPTEKSGFKSYYISSEELVKVLSEFEFVAEKKRTRTWLHVNVNDYRIEKFDEPRTF